MDLFGDYVVYPSHSCRWEHWRTYFPPAVRHTRLEKKLSRCLSEVADLWVHLVVAKFEDTGPGGGWLPVFLDGVIRQHRGPQTIEVLEKLRKVWTSSFVT
jgi:hypothetical protein